MSNNSSIISNIIHIILFLFVLLVPFSDDTSILLLYAISVPNLLLHWAFNSDVCTITMIEKFVSSKIINGYDNNNCISCKIIDPIYTLPTTYANKMNIINIVMIVLWLFVIFKLVKKYKKGKFKNIFEFFKS